MTLVNFGNFDNDGLITFTMSSNFTKFENSLNKSNHISKYFIRKAFPRVRGWLFVDTFRLQCQCHKLNYKIYTF